MRLKIGLLLAVLGFVCFGQIAMAQFENGGVTGEIRDSSGAVVPGALITVTSVENGTSYSRTSDAAGQYSVPSLRIGTYKVVATKQGYSQAVATNIEVVVGTTQRVDLSLAAGSAQEVVQVMGSALTLDTENSQRAQIITSEQIEAFPLISLDYTDLVSLTTGVTSSPIGVNDGTTSLVRQGSFSVNGQRSMYNDYLLDGMDNNAHGVSNQGFSNQIIVPSQNSVGQFSVVTNNQGAEYGRASGATINATFKSGTNKFHGEIYDYLRNTDLNANGYFVVATGKPVLIRNQFGMNIGGPIKHDKFFYFLDYEGFRQIRSQVNYSNVFKVSDHNLAIGAVQDPRTGIQYNGTAQPTLMPANISPIALAILNTFPLPNAPGVLPTSATNNYLALQRFTDDSDKYDLRLDGQLTDRTSAFARISQSKEFAVDGPILPEPLDGAVNGNQRIINQQLALGITHQLGAAQLLEFRLGVSHTKGSKATQAVGDPRTYGIPGLPTDPRIAGGLVSQVLSGYTTFGRQATSPQWQYPFLFDPKVSYSWLRGRHNFKVGYEYQYLQEIDADTNPLYGRMTYAGSFSGSVIGDFLFGTPSKIELTNFYVAHLRSNSHFAYVQDNWRIANNLTLNLGVRYEYGGHYWEKDNSQTNFDPVNTPVTGQMLHATNGSTYSRALVDPDLNDFAPRLGFAYQMHKNILFHGGYGISFVHFTRNAESDVLAINGPQVVVALSNQVPAFPKTGTGTPTANYRTIDAGYPSTFTSQANYNIGSSTITYVPRNIRDPYIQSYFLDTQVELRKNIILNIAYVGNHSVALEEVGNFNQRNPALGRVIPGNTSTPYIRPYPSLADIIYSFNGARQNYNGLQVRYEQRKVAGFTILDSFTWSRTFDTASGNLEYKYGHAPSPQNIYNLRADYGPSEYDRPLLNITSIVYTIPVGRGRRYLSHVGKGIDALIGGWQISAINTMNAGPALTPTYSVAAANQVSGITAAYGGANNYRPWRVPGVTDYLAHKAGCPTTYFFNTASTTTLPCNDPTKVAFRTTNPVAGQDTPFGDTPSGAIRGEPLYNLDMALNKTFALPFFDWKLQFRGQFYNVLNKTNFQPPGLTCCSTSFGVITATYPARIGQVALKLLF